MNPQNALELARNESDAYNADARNREKTNLCWRPNCPNNRSQWHKVYCCDDCGELDREARHRMAQAIEDATPTPPCQGCGTTDDEYRKDWLKHYAYCQQCRQKPR